MFITRILDTKTTRLSKSAKPANGLRPPERSPSQALSQVCQPTSIDGDRRKDLTTYGRMPQQIKQKLQTDREAALKMQTSVRDDGRGNDTRPVTSARAVRSAATSRWLEQRPKQEQWTAVARVGNQESGKSRPTAKI